MLLRVLRQLSAGGARSAWRAHTPHTPDRGIQAPPASFLPTAPAFVPLTACLHTSTTNSMPQASAPSAPTTPSWDCRRPLHARVRVNDLQQQAAYYTQHFGMQLLKRGPDGRSAFLGYGPLESSFSVQLVEDGRPLDMGTGFGHFGIVLPDVYAAVARIKQEGGKVTRDAGPVKGGETVIAFVEDPSGYKWELIQRGATPEPLCQVMLRVGELPRSTRWYSDVLCMQLVRERDSPEYKYSLGFMGFGPEERSAVVELTYNYGSTTYSRGDAFEYVAISTTDVKRAAQEIQAAGGTVLQGPAVLEEAGGALACVTEDPDGWRFVLVETK